MPGPIVPVLIGAGLLAAADTGTKKAKKKAKKPKKSRAQEVAAIEAAAKRLKSKIRGFGFFASADSGQSRRHKAITSQAKAAVKVDASLSKLSTKEQSELKKKLEKKLEGATQEACKKLKSAYPHVPSVQRLTCKESPKELIELAINDAAIGLTAGMTIALDVDVGKMATDIAGTVVGALKSINPF